MEYAVYRIFHDERGRKLGAYVDMFASHEEAETRARELDGEHEVVALWAREIAGDEDFGTVVFLEDGGVAPELETEDGEE